MRANFRTAITIPERSWGRFRDVISEFALRQQQQPPQYGPSQSHSVGVVSGVGGSAGDAGGGDKELPATSLVVDSAATTSVAAAANSSN